MAKVKKAKKIRREDGPYSKADVMADETIAAPSLPECLDVVMNEVAGEAKKKMSRKELRQLELKLDRERTEAAEAEREASLPVEEQTRRKLRRNQLAEFRTAKKRVAELKKQRSKLGKKKRDSKKSINAKIRSILDNLKAKHAAEWTLAGFDPKAELIDTDKDMMEE